MASKPTERNRIEALPRRDAGALLKSGLDLIEDGVAVFDQDLILVARNTSFCTLSGFPTICASPG